MTAIKTMMERQSTSRGTAPVWALCLIGAALLGQQKYAEAEPMLLRGYEGMKKREATIPANRKFYVAEAANRLVQLYDAWDRPEDAARWRQELAARKAPPKDEKKPSPKKQPDSHE